MVWANAPDGYYDNAVGLTGSELVDSIHSIIDNHSVLKYTNSAYQTTTCHIVAFTLSLTFSIQYNLLA